MERLLRPMVRSAVVVLTWSTGRRFWHSKFNLSQSARLDQRSRIAMWSLLVFVALIGVSRTCEPIRVELCRGLGYNLTGMPNLVGHELQGDADFTLQTFSPLIQYGCSAQLHFFLCSVYVPMCTEKVNGPIGPCRALCESVRARCFPVLQGFGFPWPAALNCSKFPIENNHEHMCMEGPREVSVAAIPASQISRLVLENRPIQRQTFPCVGLAQPHLYAYMNRSGQCVQLCDSEVLFNREDKRLAGTWLAFCTVLASVCSLFGLLACIIEGNTPFSYPHRAFLYLSVCYTLAGVGWMVRLLLGRQISCQIDPSEPFTALLTQAAISAPVKHNCALLFLLLFYFNNSASVW